MDKVCVKAFVGQLPDFLKFKHAAGAAHPRNQCKRSPCLQNDYYGGSDASFSLEALHSWASSLPADAQLAAFATVGDAVPELPAELSRLARRFSIDINPRFVLSKGSMVDLLISSETTHYLEFKTSEGLFHVHGAPKTGAPACTRVQQVPASKADVFQHSMGPLDKRRLMKFIQVSV